MAFFRTFLKMFLVGIVALISVSSCEQNYRVLSGAPEGVYPVPAQGNSHQVMLRPMAGITISAPENALDHNRKISLDFAGSGEWKMAVKALKEEQTIPLCAFEFDAGMKPDEIIPGNFSISFDLKQMGIPANLYHRVQIWRVPQKDMDQYYQYSSKINGNKLTIKSNQNSLLVVCLGTAAVTYGVMKFVHAVQEVYLRKYFGKGGDHCISTDVDDPNGNFTVYFKFTDTERPNGAKAYLQNEEAAFKRLAQLEKKADKEVENRINLSVGGQAEMGWWDKWKLRKEREAARKRIDREAILQNLIATDPVLTKLNTSPDATLPEGVRRVIDMVKWSNAYLAQAHVRPLDIRMEVYIVDESVIDDDAGRAVKRVGGKPFLLINNKYLYESNGAGGKRFSSAPKKGQSSLITIVHEIFHARQQTNYCPVHMAMFPAEATAAVLEADAARWFYSKKMIGTNPDGPQKDQLEWSPRSYVEIFARPLDEITASDKYSILDLGSPSRLWEKTSQELSNASEVGYTMAYVIEAVREVSPQPNRSMHYVVAQYPQHGASFAEMTQRGLGMKDKEFDKGWVHFCDKWMLTMFNKQYSLSDHDKVGAMTECYSLELPMSEGRPVHELKIDKKNYYFRTWNSVFQKGSNEIFSFFITNKLGNISPKVNFYLSGDKTPFKDGGNVKSHYVENTKSLRIAAAVTSNYYNQKEEKYYGVALYKPRKIEKLKVEDNRIIFSLPKVTKTIRKEGFLTGAVVTLTPDKGNKLTLKVKEEDLDKNVTWAIKDARKKSFKLSVHWYYEESKGVVYRSPESDFITQTGKVEEVEEASTPQGELYPADLDEDFYLTRIESMWGLENFGDYFKEHRIAGHISARNGHFTVTFPSMKGKLDKNSYDLSSMSFSGEYTVTDTEKSYTLFGYIKTASSFTRSYLVPSSSNYWKHSKHEVKPYNPNAGSDPRNNSFLSVELDKKNKTSVVVVWTRTKTTNWSGYKPEEKQHGEESPWFGGYIKREGYIPLHWYHDYQR